MASVILKNVNLYYQIHNSSSLSLQSAMFSAVGGQISTHKKSAQVKSLDNISFVLEDGDRLGVVGHNGAGKTSLLRVIAGAYTPTTGDISIDGSIASFTNITLGMDPESTGFENIFFRLVFMGVTFKKARSLISSIAEFSELGDFLYMPVRTYSTGMFLRLAFSIATSIQNDILVMDELIGAGDAAFFEKAQNRLNDCVNKSRILILASHNNQIIKKMCNKILWLRNGRIVSYGPVEDVFSKFINETL